MANSAFTKSSLPTPVSIANGGTASASAAAAIAALGGLPVAGGTMTGNITMGANTSTIYDTVLSVDGQYIGITESGTAAATLAFGDVCYFVAASSKWTLAKADASATAGPVKIGICVLAASGDAQPTRMMLFGKIRADAKFPTLTIGAQVYISAATAGLIVTAQPAATDNIIRVVGFGNTADELYFNPSGDYIIHI